MNTDISNAKDFTQKLTIKHHFIAAKGVFTQQWITARAYLANTVIFIFIPFILALLPILMFNALDVDDATLSNNFFGGGNVQYLNGYIVIGVNLWMLILAVLWDFSTYLRDEQYAGTLESLLMSPARRYAILAGRAAFSILFNLTVIFLSTILSLLILDRGFLFSQQFLHLLAVVGIVLIGSIPMMGMSYTIGALVLRFKEVYSFINSLQWLFGVIMGIYAPFTTLPLALKIMGYLFPGTWSVSDIRAITMGSPPMLTTLGFESLNLPILWDTIIVIAFGVFWAVFGYMIFNKVELRIKRKDGLSKY